jgi:C4-dicarboxylate-specific signal transduction histidine kinase
VNVELGNELKAELGKLGLSDEQRQYLHELTDELLLNQEKITHHGKRAGAIVYNMLEHSRRTNNGVKEPTNINALIDECLKLGYNGYQNKHKSFSSKIETHYDESTSHVNVIPQDISRVLINLLNNAFYAVQAK